MTTAVFDSAFPPSSEAPSKPSGLMRRILESLMESRARTAEKELRRYEAFLNDLGRRQEHSPAFLMQDKALSFKV